MKKLIIKLLCLTFSLVAFNHTNALDDDNDKIENNIDLCIGTNSWSVIDDFWCAEYQKDDDKDWVKNDKDLCKNTPEDSFVDSTNWCSNTQKDIDTDWDTIKDYLDTDIDWDWLSNNDENIWWNINFIWPNWITLNQKVISSIYLSDIDWDWINDLEEKNKWTNPNNNDTDSDGIKDNIDLEITHLWYINYIDKNWKFSQEIFNNSDDDKDWIKNNKDLCWWTLSWKEVNADWCSLIQSKLKVNDNDLDWVPDKDWSGNTIDEDNNTPYNLKKFVNLSWNYDWSTNYWEWFSYSTPPSIDNIKVTTEDTWREVNNEKLERLWENNEFFNTSVWWEKWLKLFILNIARDLRVMAFTFVLFLVVIMVLKLIFTENTEEQQKKLKIWIVWSTIWIMIMQIAFSTYKLMYDKDIWGNLARNFWDKIIQPFIDLLLYLASFIFIAMAIVAFYNLVTAWWNEEWIKKWRKTILYWIIGFIIIKFSSIVVKNTFNPDCWKSWWIISFWGSNVCENIKDNSKIIFTLINWFNTFVSLIIVIMLIYWWFIVLTSWWDEEKSKKAKNIFLYSFIGVLILFASYLILTFFIKK